MKTKNLRNQSSLSRPNSSISSQPWLPAITTLMVRNRISKSLFTTYPDWRVSSMATKYLNKSSSDMVDLVCYQKEV